VAPRRILHIALNWLPYSQHRDSSAIMYCQGAAASGCKREFCASDKLHLVTVIGVVKASLSTCPSWKGADKSALTNTTDGCTCTSFAAMTPSRVDTYIRLFQLLCLETKLPKHWLLIKPQQYDFPNRGYKCSSMILDNSNSRLCMFVGYNKHPGPPQL
jgi:hypothetical protein